MNTIPRQRLLFGIWLILGCSLAFLSGLVVTFALPTAQCFNSRVIAVFWPLVFRELPAYSLLATETSLKSDKTEKEFERNTNLTTISSAE